MKQTFKYLNDNRKSCILGVQDLMPENIKVVRPGEVSTFEMDVEDDDVIFIKTWKHDDKILIATHKQSVWEVRSGESTESVKQST